MRLDRDATPEHWLDLDGDGTIEYKFDHTNAQFCFDPDDNENCDIILKDYGVHPVARVGIAFHGAVLPTIMHDDTAKTLNNDLDEDGTYEMTIDGSAQQVTLDPDSDGVNDMLLNKTFLQTDQIRYSSTSAARMTATNGRMHLCGGNQFAPNAAAGACMYLGGSTGTYANTQGFDPDGDGTDEATINNLGVYSGQATTAGALATDPVGCTNQFVTDMAAAGALTCNSVTGSYITDGTILEADLTWNSTAARSAGQAIVVASDTTKFDVVAFPTDTGDELTVDGTATTTPNLDDGGDVDFSYNGTSKAITGVVKANSVALGTDTTGNYAGSSSEGGAATTATALAADPSDCASGAYATAIDASGTLTCTKPTQTLEWASGAALYTVDPHIFKAPAALTIVGIDCIVFAATSVVLSVEECNSSGASCAGVDGSTTITCDTDGAADDGALSNPSIDSGDWIKFNFGTHTGSTGGAAVTIRYTIP